MNHYISPPAEVLWVEMIIRDCERLDIFRLGANRDTVESIMMDESHEGQRGQSMVRMKTNISLSSSAGTMLSKAVTHYTSLKQMWVENFNI